MCTCVVSRGEDDHRSKGQAYGFWVGGVVTRRQRGSGCAAA